MSEPAFGEGKRVSHVRTAFPAVDTDWMDNAACKGTDRYLWFPGSGDVITANKAKGICKGCPVKVQCLDWAYYAGCTDGIFGGMDATERRNERRRKQRRSSH